MGFFNGLNLVLLTIAPLVMFHTASVQRQPSVTTHMFRLLGLIILAVGCELLKGFFAANGSFVIKQLSSLVFASSQTSVAASQSSDPSSCALLTAISAGFDVLILFYLASGAIPRKALGIVVPEEESAEVDEVRGQQQQLGSRKTNSSLSENFLSPICQTNLNCHLECAFGAAFWIVHFAGPMVSNIRSTPGSNADFLVSAVVCFAHYVFIALVVSVGNSVSSSSFSSSRRSSARSGGSSTPSSLILAATVVASIICSEYFLMPVIGVAPPLVYGASSVAAVAVFRLFALIPTRKLDVKKEQ